MFIRKTSLARGRTLNETVKLINSSVANGEYSSIMSSQKIAAKLGQDGILATLAKIGTSAPSSLAHIGKNERNLLTIQRLEIFSTSFQASKYTFLLGKISITIFKSGFI